MAIDPLTAKLLVQAAARAATDEESRRRTLILILAPILGLLLLIAFILYLITSPFSMLSQWLVGDEVSVVENFQKEYGYNQQLGIYEKDYIEGSGQSYEGVVFTDGGREVIYYNQLDERYHVRHIRHDWRGRMRPHGDGDCHIDPDRDAP